MSWLPLAVLTAVAFGVYHVAIKLSAGRIDQILGAVVLQTVAALVGGGLALALRLGGRSFVVSGAGLGWAVAAGIAVGLAEILSFVLFSRGAPVAAATPIMMGGAVVVTALVGLVVLGERLAASQVGGIVLVAAGIALLSSGGRP